MQVIRYANTNFTHKRLQQNMVGFKGYFSGNKISPVQQKIQQLDKLLPPADEALKRGFLLEDEWVGGYAPGGFTKYAQINREYSLPGSSYIETTLPFRVPAGRKLFTAYCREIKPAGYLPDGKRVGGYWCKNKGREFWCDIGKTNHYYITFDDTGKIYKTLKKTEDRGTITLARKKAEEYLSNSLDWALNPNKAELTNEEAYLLGHVSYDTWQNHVVRKDPSLRVWKVTEIQQLPKARSNR